MIVGSYFDGDDDMGVAWKQHDVYGTALSIICSTCNNFARFAKAVLGEPSGYQSWGEFGQCDHRMLQAAHDLLAAAWRFRNPTRQLNLPLTGTEPTVPVEEFWLNWLRQELSDWIASPRLVRSVQLILSNQNQPLGYLAESQLCLDLLDRHADVPWTPKLREAYERDLANDAGRGGLSVRGLVLGREPKSEPPR